MLTRVVSWFMWVVIIKWHQLWLINSEVYPRETRGWHQRAWCLWAPPLVHRWCLFTVFSNRDSHLSGASIMAAGVSFTGVEHPDLITFERPRLLMLSYSRLSFIVWNLVGNILSTVSGHSCPFCYCHSLFVLSEIEGKQVRAIMADHP